MKRFVAWARVSSKHQEREGWSLDEQKARLEQMAAQRGGAIDRLFQIAETASKPAQRKVFGEMTAYVRRNARRLSGIMFVKVDRATRNLGDWHTLETLERDHGVNLIFPDQPSGDTPAGRFQRRMVMNMAAF